MVCGPSTPHLGELVGEMQEAAAEAQLDRHETTVWCGDAVDFLGAEGVVVEGGGLLGAVDDDVRSDRHAISLSFERPRRLGRSCL